MAETSFLLLPFSSSTVVDRSRRLGYVQSPMALLCYHCLTSVSIGYLYHMLAFVTLPPGV